MCFCFFLPFLFFNNKCAKHIIVDEKRCLENLEKSSSLITPLIHIIGYDKAPSAIRKATDNVENAHLEDFIALKQADFFHTEKEVEGKTIILFNPPYGERLEIDDVPAFYKEIGDTLKRSYTNTNAWTKRLYFGNLGLACCMG